MFHWEQNQNTQRKSIAPTTATARWKKRLQKTVWHVQSDVKCLISERADRHNKEKKGEIEAEEPKWSKIWQMHWKEKWVMLERRTKKIKERRLCILGAEKLLCSREIHEDRCGSRVNCEILDWILVMVWIRFVFCSPAEGRSLRSYGTFRNWSPAGSWQLEADLWKLQPGPDSGTLYVSWWAMMWGASTMNIVMLSPLWWTNIISQNFSSPALYLSDILLIAMQK